MSEREADLRSAGIASWTRAHAPAKSPRYVPHASILKAMTSGQSWNRVPGPAASSNTTAAAAAMSVRRAIMAAGRIPRRFNPWMK
jgi:hypothetical protein